MGKLRDGLTLQNIDKYLPVLYERRCTLLDYLPEDAPLFVCEPAGVREELRSANRLMTEDMKVLFEEGVLFEGCDRYLMDYNRIAEEAAVRPTLFMDTFTRSIGDIPLKGLYNIDAVQLAVWGGELAHLTEDLDAYLDSGYTVCILAGTEKAGRALTSDLVGKGYNADYAADLPALTPKKVYVLPGSLSAGFEYPEIKLAVFTHGTGGRFPKKAPQDKAEIRPHPLAGRPHPRGLCGACHPWHRRIRGDHQAGDPRGGQGLHQDPLCRHRYALCAGHPAGSGIQVHRRAERMAASGSTSSTPPSGARPRHGSRRLWRIWQMS